MNIVVLSKRRNILDSVQSLTFLPAEDPQTALDMISGLRKSNLLVADQEMADAQFLQSVRKIDPSCEAVIISPPGEPVLSQSAVWEKVNGVYRQGSTHGNVLSSGEETFYDILSMEYIHDIIYGHPERLQEIWHLLVCAKIDIVPQIIMTALYDDFWNICRKLHNRHRYRLKRVMLNSIRAAMQLDMAGVAATLIGTDKVIIALNCGDRKGIDAEQYAESCAAKIRSWVLKETGISITFGISDYCSDTHCLWQAYEQSFQALNRSFGQGQGQSLHYALAEKVSVQPDIQGITKREIIQAFHEGDFQRCKQVVLQFTRLLSENNIDTVEIKALATILLSEFAQYGTALGLESEVLSQQLVGTISGISQSSTIQDMQEKMLVFLQNMIQKHRNNSSDGIRKIIGITKAYIEQYHSEPLTLSAVAELVGYSPFYFSRQFKAHVGMSFSQYLIQVRITHGKNMLANSSASIDEVAVQTGFQSRSYFNVAFKRATGLTPNQYRKQYEKK